MAKVFGLSSGQNGTKNINMKIPTSGTTPVNAVASQGVLTIGAQVTADNTMTIGDVVYTFKAGATAAAGEIGIGADVAACRLAIVAAINGTDTKNDANPYVSASAFSTADCTLTARVKGVSVDAIATTETFTSASNKFDGDTLGTETAGVNGTIGDGGDCYIDDSYLYYAIKDNRIIDTNWRRISLGSAY